MAALNYFLLSFDIQSSESISVWMDVSKYMSMYSLYISEQLKGNPNPSDIFFPLFTSKVGTWAKIRVTKTDTVDIMTNWTSSAAWETCIKDK